METYLAEAKQLHILLDVDRAAAGLQDCLELAQSLGLDRRRLGDPDLGRGICHGRTTVRRLVINAHLQSLCPLKEDLVAVADQAGRWKGVVSVRCGDVDEEAQGGLTWSRCV
jgi:hypothetical protein